jgi:hypothetical protein
MGVTSTETPLPLPSFQIRGVAPKVAMMDAGIAWLFEQLQQAAQVEQAPRKKRR